MRDGSTTSARIGRAEGVRWPRTSAAVRSLIASSCPGYRCSPLRLQHPQWICHGRSAAAAQPPAARRRGFAARLGIAAAGLGVAAARVGSAAAGWGQPPPVWRPAARPGERPQPGWNPGFMPSQVGSGRFRSMSVGEWLDATFTLYRRNFVADRLDQRRGADPLRAADLAALRGHRGLDAFVRSPFASLGHADHHAGAGAATPQLLSRCVRRERRSAAAHLLSWSLPLGEAATTRAVSDRYLDRPSSLAAAYRAALEPARLADHDDPASSVGAYVGIARGRDPAGRCSSAPPAPVRSGRCSPSLRSSRSSRRLIIVYVRTVVAVPAIVLERVSGWHGLQRSWQLIDGRFWPTFGRMLLLALISRRSSRR